MSQPLVFIVDDDPVFSHILGMMLNQNGFEHLVFFTSAEKCLDSLGEDPAFLFLDYQLEGMDGLTALREIKRHPYPITVFLITSVEDRQIKEACFREGAELFLNKNDFLKGFPEKVLKIMK